MFILTPFFPNPFREGVISGQRFIAGSRSASNPLLVPPDTRSGDVILVMQTQASSSGPNRPSGYTTIYQTGFDSGSAASPTFSYLQVGDEIPTTIPVSSYSPFCDTIVVLLRNVAIDQLLYDFSNSNGTFTLNYTPDKDGIFIAYAGVDNEIQLADWSGGPIQLGRKPQGQTDAGCLGYYYAKAGEALSVSLTGVQSGNIDNRGYIFIPFAKQLIPSAITTYSANSTLIETSNILLLSSDVRTTYNFDYTGTPYEISIEGGSWATTGSVDASANSNIRLRTTSQSLDDTIVINSIKVADRSLAWTIDTTTIDLYAGSTVSETFTVPPGVYTISMFGVGKGGNGSLADDNDAGAGGGGGAFAYTPSVSVAPGEILTISISSTYSNISNVTHTIVSARAGSNGVTQSSGNTAGGLASLSIGQTKYSGGQGGRANFGAYTGNGGGAASIFGDGEIGGYMNPAVAGVAGTGGNAYILSSNEFVFNQGVYPSAIGDPGGAGASYGAGGGGGAEGGFISGRTGGSGGDGAIILTWGSRNIIP